MRSWDDELPPEEVHVRVPGFLLDLDPPEEALDLDEVPGDVLELRDGGLVVARIPVYSYRDELPPERPAVEPTTATWSDVWQALAGFIVLGLLFLALFVLWPALQAHR